MKFPRLCWLYSSEFQPLRHLAIHLIFDLLEILLVRDAQMSIIFGSSSYQEVDLFLHSLNLG